MPLQCPLSCSEAASLLDTLLRLCHTGCFRKQHSIVMKDRKLLINGTSLQCPLPHASLFLVFTWLCGRVLVFRLWISVVGLLAPTRPPVRACEGFPSSPNLQAVLHLAFLARRLLRRVGDALIQKDVRAAGREPGCPQSTLHPRRPQDPFPPTPSPPLVLGAPGPPSPGTANGPHVGSFLSARP